MVSTRLLLVAAASLPTAFAGMVQKPGLKLPPGADKSREQVTQIFTNAFSAYTKFAFGHDDLSRQSILHVCVVCAQLTR